MSLVGNDAISVTIVFVCDILRKHAVRNITIFIRVMQLQNYHGYVDFDFVFSV